MTRDGAVAVWLYGSRARGDSDELSDTDLLVVSDDPSDERPTLAPITTNASVSSYSWGEITGMASYGSLFLYHVGTEGKPVYESSAAAGRLEALLGTIGPYRGAARDVTAFRTVLNDVRDSLDSGEAALVFELSVLATVFRHASVLGCYIAHSPCFARTQSVARLISMWNLPKEWATEFASVYQYRMYAARRVRRVDPPSSDLAYRWWGRADLVVDEISRRIDGRA